MCGRILSLSLRDNLSEILATSNGPLCRRTCAIPPAVDVFCVHIAQDANAPSDRRELLELRRFSLRATPVTVVTSSDRNGQHFITGSFTDHYSVRRRNTATNGTHNKSCLRHIVQPMTPRKCKPARGLFWNQVILLWSAVARHHRAGRQTKSVRQGPVPQKTLCWL